VQEKPVNLQINAIKYSKKLEIPMLPQNNVKHLIVSSN
jgi:hypothetical protein